MEADLDKGGQQGEPDVIKHHQTAQTQQHGGKYGTEIRNEIQQGDDAAPHQRRWHVDQVKRQGNGRTQAQINNGNRRHIRSEEHTSELQSLMRISYAVFCLKKQKTKNIT